MLKILVSIRLFFFNHDLIIYANRFIYAKYYKTYIVVW